MYKLYADLYILLLESVQLFAALLSKKKTYRINLIICPASNCFNFVKSQQIRKPTYHMHALITVITFYWICC